MRVFVDLVTEEKPSFLNHEDPRAWFLTDVEQKAIHELPKPLLNTSMVQSIVVLNTMLY